MCKVLQVSTSGYYYWLRYPEGKNFKRNNELLFKIKMIHSKSKGTYGSPRITKELNVSGTKTSQKTVARIMRKNKIRSKIKKKFKTTKALKRVG